MTDPERTTSELTPNERRLLPERREAYELHRGRPLDMSSRLEAARRARGLSQQSLADAVGVGKATIKRLEAKRQQKTPVQVLARCALVLEVPLVALIDAQDLEWDLPWTQPHWSEVSDVLVSQTPPLPKV